MLKEEVLKTIKKYNLINSGDVIVIGVSGGPDSICLLHVLNELKNELEIKIYVAHVNHMIRAVADEETKYVEDICKKLDVDCYIKKVDILEMSKKAKKGTEETGREARYSFFAEVAKKTGSNKIATAHNSNDKVETVILNILRGSGTRGLKGIEAIRDEKFIRPLIETSRDKIENYCKENHLEPKYDESNNENIYNRNKVRNVIIPYIQKEFNPNILKTISRLSQVATEENEYLDQITKEAFDKLYINKEMPTSHLPLPTSIILDLKKFNSLELVIKRRVILYTVNELMGSTVGIEKINIDDIIKLCQNNIGNKYLKPTKNIKIMIKNKKIFFSLEPDLP